MSSLILLSFIGIMLQLSFAFRVSTLSHGRRMMSQLSMTGGEISYKVGFMFPGQGGKKNQSSSL